MNCPPAREFRVEEFYGAGGMPTDISRGLKGTVQWAGLQGGGRVSIPRGLWQTDPLVIENENPLRFSGPLPNSPIWIEGEGRGVTVLKGWPDAGKYLLDWQCALTGNAVYGGLRNIELRASAPAVVPGHGFRFGENMLFMDASDVVVDGFMDGVTVEYIQDSHFTRVHSAQNMRNWVMSRPHQVSMHQCEANQARVGGLGLWMDWGWLTWTDGLLQGGGVRIEPPTPSSVRFTMRGVFIEQNEQPFDFRAPPGFPNGSSGNIRLEDLSFNVGSSFPLVEAHGYTIWMSNWVQGDPQVWAKMYGCQVYADGLPPKAGRWKCDALSAIYNRGPAVWEATL